MIYSLSLSLALVAVAGGVGGGSAAAGMQSPRDALAFAGGQGPAWSPDGTQIAYVGPAPKKSSDPSCANHVIGSCGLDKVIVVQSDGSGASHVVSTAPRNEALDEVRWGRGGRFIYSDTNYTLWSDTGTRGGGATKLASLGVTSGVGESFSLSADGSQVAFTAPCRCGIAQGNAVGVGDLTFARPKLRILPRPKNALDQNPAFAPDGRHVVFMRLLIRKGAPKPPLNQLVVQPVHGTTARSLHLNGDWPAYAPNGHWIAFFARPGLEIATASGRNPRLLLPFQYVDGTASFSWSPDSTKLVYATSTKIGTVDLANRRTAFPIPGLRPEINTPQWSPNGNSIAFTAVKKGADRDIRVYVVSADGSGLHRVA